MGQGISFYEGNEAKSVGNTSTQPDAPKKSSGGPISSPSGLESGSNHSSTTPSGSQPSGLGSSFVSPADK